MYQHEIPTQIFQPFFIRLSKVRNIFLRKIHFITRTHTHRKVSCSHVTYIYIIMLGDGSKKVICPPDPADGDRSGLSITTSHKKYHRKKFAYPTQPHCLFGISSQV